MCLGTPELQAKLKKNGAKGQPGTPAAFADFVATEQPKWIAMVKLSGVSTK
jgi:tripartite-type tricarboxylate transporter receptor subunit TctC